MFLSSILAGSNAYLLPLILLLFITLMLFTWKRKNIKKLYNLPPGPFLNNIPIVGYLPFMSNAPHLHLCELAKTYGDVYTLKFGSYDILIINSLPLIRTLFKDQVYSGRPNHLLAMEVSKNGITFATGQEALEQRRFALKTLRDFGFGKSSMECLIMEEVNELVGYFKSFADGSTHELKYLFGLSVINALWSVLASRKFTITDLVARRAYQVCIEGFIDPPVSGALWFLPSIAKAFPQASGYTSVTMAVTELKALVSEVVDSHKVEYEQRKRINSALPPQHQDFVDAYLARIEEEVDPQSSFYGERGYNNLVHTLIDLFTAGSDTLNSSINFAIKYLCENPQIQSDIHSEIDNILQTSSSSTVAYEDRKFLPLLDAVITETLRISSIVTGGILHSTTEDTKMVVRGKNSESKAYNLPKGTIVMANLYWVHHDPKLWNNPDVFDPYRFINDDRKDDVIAFSTGRRVCIAEQMAQVEFFLFLGGLLANFRFEGVSDGRWNRSVGSVKSNVFGGVKSGLVLNVDGLVVKVFERRKK